MLRTVTYLIISLVILIQTPAISYEDDVKTLSELQEDFINMRFGMFIHFSIQTFLNVEHAPPGQDVAIFNPIKLDCSQWADVARSAKMTYGVLTTKHHDGFSLWNSLVTEYDVANSSFGGDVVGEFVEAFRSRGLKVGLYYSIRDKQHNIKKGSVTTEKVELIKTQLTELLSNYGDIDMVVFDGWGNNWHDSPSFEEITYEEIYWHVKSIQPECLIITHQQDPSVTEIIHFEQNAGQKISIDNSLPAQSGPCLQSRWFWDLKHPHEELKSVDFVINECLRPFNDIHCNLLLNCAPNREGLMDLNVVKRLAEIGEAWSLPKPIKYIPENWDDWPIPQKDKGNFK